MFRVPYEPLDKTKSEIRLIQLKDVDEVENTGPPTGSPLKCQLIKTSLKLYTRYYSPIVRDGNTLRQSMARIAFSKTKFPQPFYALSYVWGDPTAACDININGEMARIPRNLNEALLSIRDNTEFRVIWADALCINQDDNDEKC